MTLKFKSEAEFAEWNAARHKATEARQAECSCVPCQRSRAEKEQAEMKARGLTHAQLTAERATAAAQGEAARQAADMESAYYAGKLQLPERKEMRAAIATRRATEGITEGLRDVLAIAEGDGRSMIEALAHYDKIETNAATAQYAIESTLPWAERRRSRLDWTWAFFALVFAVALVIMWQNN